MYFSKGAQKKHYLLNHELHQITLPNYDLNLLSDSSRNDHRIYTPLLKRNPNFAYLSSIRVLLRNKILKFKFYLNVLSIGCRFPLSNKCFKLCTHIKNNEKNKKLCNFFFRIRYIEL